MVNPDVLPQQVVSPNVQGVVLKVVDVGNQFKNEQKFKCHDQMLQRIHMKTSKLGFGVVIGSSENGSDRRRAFVTMTCERSGAEILNKTTLVQENVSVPLSRASNCVSTHAGREGVRCDMTLNLVQPKNILATLKRKRPRNISNTKYRTCDDGVTVRDIFWTYPDFKKLFNTFPTVFILDSMYRTNKYHITTNVISQVKPAVGTKQIKTEDGKMVKAGVVVEKLMDAWNRIVDSFTKELHADFVMHFRKVCEKYPDLLKCVESTILDQVKKKIVCAWTDQLVGNMSRAGLNYIFYGAKQVDNVGSDSAKYECTIEKTYGLPCACVIAKKVKLGSPIRMDEACTYWKKLRFDDDGVMKDSKSSISILTE
ncbi:uncharacterized protein LOC127138021 [Lathyrus oleraceus]|uniref:uncharacterized protein LOC127138021 n=1 Tax=Pisum sativum TaxID=3888 RepID=UPI0021D0F9F6|nr:uncharacterized protein LOC127138021 [Pisum sativum]